jgi:hypothetical protein
MLFRRNSKSPPAPQHYAAETTGCYVPGAVPLCLASGTVSDRRRRKPTSKPGIGGEPLKPTASAGSLRPLDCATVRFHRSQASSEVRSAASHRPAAFCTKVTSYYSCSWRHLEYEITARGRERRRLATKKARRLDKRRQALPARYHSCWLGLFPKNRTPSCPITEANRSCIPAIRDRLPQDRSRASFGIRSRLRRTDPQLSARAGFLLFPFTAFRMELCL